jgi:hypothetical protein
VIQQIVALPLVIVSYLAPFLISWRSKKQIVVARSSTELEYNALAYTTSELLWLQWLLHDMGVSLSKATPIYCDSISTIQIAHKIYFINGPNILRLIATLSHIFFKDHYSFILSHPMISSQTSLKSQIV